MHKHKTMKFDVVGERPVTNYIPKSGEQTKKSRKLHRLKTQPMVSEASRKQNGAIPQDSGEDCSEDLSLEKISLKIEGKADRTPYVYKFIKDKSLEKIIANHKRHRQ